MTLPEKEWLTLEEIAKRWGCSVEDLWHYSETGRLRLSIRPTKPIRLVNCLGKLPPPPPSAWRYDNKSVPIFIGRGPFGFESPDARVPEDPGAIYLDEVTIALPCVLNEGNGWKGMFMITPGLDDEPTKAPVVIVRAERERFEQEYRIGAAAGKMPSEGEMQAAALFSRTDLLRKMAEANEKFWRLYDPADPSTAPTNEQVVAYLRERGASQRIAEAIATILRAEDLPTGPRK